MGGSKLLLCQGDPSHCGTTFPWEGMENLLLTEENVYQLGISRLIVHSECLTINLDGCPGKCAERLAEIQCDDTLHVIVDCEENCYPGSMRAA